MRKPVISAEQAAWQLADGDTLTTGGFGSCGHPEALTQAIAERFSRTGSPRDLTLVFAAGQGDRADRGLNRLALDGLLKRVVGGYWALTPKLAALAMSNRIEAYNWPQGVVSHWFRAVAGHKPGVITKVGMQTFVDPRYGGSKINPAARQDLVHTVSLLGEEYLFFPSGPVHVALLRGTRADTEGNVTLEDEANFQDTFAQAAAAHNSGGTVIFQVREVVEAGSLPAHEVRIPGICVDYLVISPDGNHWQTYGERFNPAYTGRYRIVPRDQAAVPLDARKIIARRAFLEIAKHGACTVNLGIGSPERIAEIASEEGLNGSKLTVESGAIGGTPAQGLSFGAASSPEALLDQPSQFDLYDGGMLDIAFLGFGQVDAAGNVNVSRLGGKFKGVGGFINISQCARKVVFCGLFTCGGCGVEVRDGAVRVVREGAVKKFVEAVDHLSFSAERAVACGQQVLYVTERAVFELYPKSVRLTEVAPGIDIERDILSRADARIEVAREVRQMRKEIFAAHRMGEAVFPAS